MTMLSLIVLRPSTRVRIAKEGRIAQNSLPGTRSTLRSGISGTPNQPAAATRPPSMTPNGMATADPARMLMNGAAIRHRPLACSVRTTDASSVMPAIAGPAIDGASSGRSCTVSNAMGSTLTAMSIVTVPETTGVMIRRSVGSHQASPIWIRLQAIIRLANVAVPAAVMVVTMIAMNIAAGHESTTWPAPNRRSWNACSVVIAAQISMAAKTLQVRCVSPSPAARIAIATLSTVGASTSTAP